MIALDIWRTRRKGCIVACSLPVPQLVCFIRGLWRFGQFPSPSINVSERIPWPSILNHFEQILLIWDGMDGFGQVSQMISVRRFGCFFRIKAIPVFPDGFQNALLMRERLRRFVPWSSSQPDSQVYFIHSGRTWHRCILLVEYHMSSDQIPCCLGKKGDEKLPSKKKGTIS